MTSPTSTPSARRREPRTAGIRTRVAWVVAAGLLVAALVAVAVHARNISTLSASASARLPGMLTTPAPWPKNTEWLGERLDRLGLPPAGSVEHVHVFLTIFVKGERVGVPANIGLTRSTEAPVHVHVGEPGIVHVESLLPFWRATLGEFFDIWGVRLTSACLGGYCLGGNDRLEVFVDARRFRGDPRELPLSDHADIAVVFGTPDEIPGRLPTFDWAAFG